MEEPTTAGDDSKPPATSFEKFAGTVPAIIIGIVVGVGLSVLMMCFGVYNTCCFLGVLIVPLFLYYFPKIFGVKKWPFFIIVGISFMLIATALGAFVVGPKAIHDAELQRDDNYFKNIVIDGEGNDLTITAEFLDSEEDLTDKYVYYVGYGIIDKVAFINISYNLGERVNGTPTPIGAVEDHHYTISFTIPNVANKLTGMILYKQVKDKDEVKESTNALFHNGLTEDELRMKCLMGAAYWTGIETALYAVICVMMMIMQKNLAKARAKMEEEGRLYPQGYNRCKDCGSIVLPGEICCRKCGAYIEVPDDIKVKKVESIQCSECGAEIPEDAKVCPRCGATFDEEEEVVEIAKDKPEEKPAETPADKPGETKSDKPNDAKEKKE